jgi:hypothetical protein
VRYSLCIWNHVLSMLLRSICHTGVMVSLSNHKPVSRSRFSRFWIPHPRKEHGTSKSGMTFSSNSPTAHSDRRVLFPQRQPSESPFKLDARFTCIIIRLPALRKVFSLFYLLTSFFCILPSVFCLIPSFF